MESAFPVSGWKSRGYLPHCEAVGLVQHVVFHLADSLPREVVEKLKMELEQLPEAQRAGEWGKRVDGLMDAGYGSCWLKEVELAEEMQRVLLYFDGARYRLIEWVIMPNHVHVLVEPMGGWALGMTVGSWKRFSGRKISDWVRARQESGARDGPLQVGWHREYWDRYMRDEAHLQRTVDYIHLNPVKAGLVKRAEDWRWSSAFGADRK